MYVQRTKERRWYDKLVLWQLSGIFIFFTPFGVRAKKEKYLEELTLVFSFSKKMLEQNRP